MEEFERPNSEQLLDLHIYVVPPDLWRSHLQSAGSQIIEETISAGFIRVHPEASVNSIRKELDLQLEYDSSDLPIPNEYVFLKSVGRCLTQVKPRQEYTLKIKSFQPPRSFASEIFVLDSAAAGIRYTPYSGSSSQSSSVRYNGTPRSDRSEFSGHRPVPPIGRSNGLTDEEQRKLDDLLRRQRELEDSELAERKRREWEAEEERRRRQQETEDERQRRQLEEEEERRRQEEEEERRRREAERRRNEENERRRLLDGEDEERRRREAEEEEEERRRRQEEEDEAERRRLEAEANMKNKRPGFGDRSLSELQDELERMRQERLNAERHREDLVKRARMLQTKTQKRRNQARDTWKKKYFEEKKKTMPLDEQCNRLRTELEALHRKIMSQLEMTKDPAKRTGDNKPSQQSPSNLKIQATKLQHEIEELGRRVENIKMKLTTEMKLRNQAQGELKALRAELTQKKINMTLIRTSHPQHPIAHTPGAMLTPRS